MTIVERLRADIGRCEHALEELRPHTRSTEFSGITWHWRTGGPDYKFSDETAWIEYVPAPAPAQPRRERCMCSCSSCLLEQCHDCVNAGAWCANTHQVFKRKDPNPFGDADYEKCAHCGKHIRQHYSSLHELPRYRCESAGGA